MNEVKSEPMTEMEAARQYIQSLPPELAERLGKYLEAKYGKKIDA